MQRIAAVLFAIPAITQAQTLGDEVVLSSLGDPVEVEIAVEDWQDFDLSQVRASNGNPEQYELFGLEYQPILDDLNFSLIGPNLAGEVKVLISTREPVSEPFLELLLVLSWSSGSTLRDYTLLFDPPLPPVATPQPPPQAVTTVTTTATSAEAVAAELLPTRQLRVVTLSPPAVPATPPAGQTETSPAAPQLTGLPDVRTQLAVDVDDVFDATASPPVPAADALNVERRPYTVRNNDTLWVIARQFQPAGDTENLYQFLVSLHDLNREAFINGNISLLRSGAELLIPTARDVSSINPATAQTLFEELWADGTRVSSGTDGALPPEFSSLQQPLEEPPVTEPAEPSRTPGTELALENRNPGLSATANTQVVAIGAEPGFDFAEPAVATDETSASLSSVPVNLVAEATFPGAAPQSPLEPSDNPYLQQVIDSAQKIQSMLEAREQRMVQVQEQLLAMTVQLQQAQIAALELNAKLQEAALVREQQKSANLRTIAFLGTLVVGLLLALGFALKQMVVLHRQIKELVQMKLAAGSRKQIVLAQEPGFFTSEQMDVVELEEIVTEHPPMPHGSEEVVRDMDKVPDIELSPKEVDFLVMEAVPAVEDPDKAPKSIA